MAIQYIKLRCFRSRGGGRTQIFHLKRTSTTQKYEHQNIIKKIPKLMYSECHISEKCYVADCWIVLIDA